MSVRTTRRRIPEDLTRNILQIEIWSTRTCKRDRLQRVQKYTLYVVLNPMRHHNHLHSAFAVINRDSRFIFERIWRLYWVVSYKAFQATATIF
jgi:hypothetical protein